MMSQGLQVINTATMESYQTFEIVRTLFGNANNVELLDVSTSKDKTLYFKQNIPSASIINRPGVAGAVL